MKIQKKNLMPSLVLGAICLTVALLLSVINSFTKGVIRANDERALQESLAEALPSTAGYRPLEVTDEMKAAAAATGQKIEITNVYEEIGGAGFVVTLENRSGYTGKPISVTVGVSRDGRVTKAIITQNPETKVTKEMEKYPERFASLTADEVASAELVAGVTFSSTAFRSSVAAALAVVGAIGQ